MARPRAQRRTLWLALAGFVALAAVFLAVIGLTTGGSGSPKPQPVPAVPSISHGTTPQEQARNIAAWLRRYSQ